MLLLFTGAIAQTDSTRKTFFTKKNLVIAGLIVQQASSSLVEYKWWWGDSSNAFHFLNDGFWHNYSYGMDKIGHAYISYLCFNAINEAMLWASFTNKQRLITSVALPAFWAISIEIGDAFAPYGFSWGDLAANFSGITYGYLQQKYPSLKNVMFKMSYYPATRNFNFSANYDAHIYWLSFNMHNILPGVVGRKWPELINLAAGYSIHGYNGGAGLNRELMVGIDINLAAIPAKNSGARAIRNLVNLIHLPSPGIIYSDDHTPQYKPLLLR